MKLCFHISHRLAAYCEGEISPQEQAHIAAHLAACADCCARAEQMRRNIHLMKRLPLPEPNHELWDAIARELSASRRPQPTRVVSFARQWSMAKRWMLRPATVMVALFVIATALLLVNQYRLLLGGRQGELNLAGYFDLVGTVASAEPALRELPTAPGFTTVDWPAARATLDFPVINPEVLPGGYRLTAAQLYLRGDIRAMQFKYCSEQSSLCVFQLPASSKLLLGNQPLELCTVGGIGCQYTRNKNCSAYHFILGGTQCLLIVCQADAAMVNSVIQAFQAEYQRAHPQKKAG